jgi:AcrR family transcriptional regulator
MTKPSVRPGQGRTRLTRERVLTAALQLIDAEGLDRLSMRRLAQDLDCNPMALYRYTANRSALLDGVVEFVVDQLIIPADGEWEALLRRTGHNFRTLALEHPQLVPLLVTRPLTTPLALRPMGTLRPLERLLELLVGVGFTPVDALHAYRVFFGCLYGHILTEVHELRTEPEDTDDVLRLALRRLPDSEFPRLRGLATALAHYDGKTELDKGLTILIAGLRTALTPEPPARRHPRINE